VIRYLIDSSALWRIQRDKLLREAWAEVISNGTVGSCQPQRTEFKSSARNHMEYEAMSDMFAELYTDVAIPKSAWQWIEATQYRLARNGGHQGLSVVDLLISATAAHHGLIVLHDDNDFATVARNVQDLRERNVNAAP
jgi:predicted nucleic acid-binding protein